MKLEFQPVHLNPLMPINRHDRYMYLQEFALPFDIEMLSYSQGGNLTTLWWCWKVEEADTDRTAKVVDGLKQDISVYHTRAMRRAFVSRYGMLSSTSPTVLTEMYREPTGDQSALSCTVTTAVHQRLKAALDAQDPDMVFDLRELNSGRPEKYQPFWDAARAFLEAHSLQAVDSRRHGTVTHLAAAVSTRDFVEQVAKTVPEGTPIPSVEWVQFQFWPSNPFTQSARWYTGKLNIRHTLQSR
eukprot:scpid36606/ scgid9200/ 